MSPYRLRSKTVLSFSGGRTSAYMLRQVLDHNDDLSDLLVLFANSGKEHPATLEFVRECAERWAAPITWLEYRDNEQGFAVVDFDTCSRDGEPFEAVIRKRKYLPNPVTRFCTVELKIRTMHRYLKSIGWTNDEGEWDQMVGIRADKPRRYHRMMAANEKGGNRWENVTPMYHAGVLKADVNSFWARQLIDLGIDSDLGNCDLCFLKLPEKIIRAIIENWALCRSSCRAASACTFGTQRCRGAAVSSIQPSTTIASTSCRAFWLAPRSTTATTWSAIQGASSYFICTKASALPVAAGHGRRMVGRTWCTT